MSKSEPNRFLPLNFVVLKLQPGHLFKEFLDLTYSKVTGDGLYDYI